MLWKYRIKTGEGDIQEGTLRTDSYQNAARELTAPGQQILSLKQCNEVSPPPRASAPVEIAEPGWGFGAKDLLALLLVAASAYYLTRRPTQWGPIVPMPSATNYTINLQGRVQFDGPASSIDQSAVRVDVYFPELGTVVTKKPAPLDPTNLYKDKLEILANQSPSQCVVEVSQRGYAPCKQTVALTPGKLQADLGVFKLQFRDQAKSKATSEKSGGP